MPISTMLDTGRPESIWVNSTWSSISAGVRSRTLPAMVEAQKAHPIRHPTWEEMHTVLPWWFCIETVLMQLPSASSQRYLMVPSSFDTCFRATLGAVRMQVSFSFSRRDLERFVIPSKSVTPRWSQVNTCLPRKAGSPRDWRNAVISGNVSDFKSVMGRS